MQKYVFLLTRKPEKTRILACFRQCLLNLLQKNITDLPFDTFIFDKN